VAKQLSAGKHNNIAIVGAGFGGIAAAILVDKALRTLAGVYL